MPCTGVAVGTGYSRFFSGIQCQKTRLNRIFAELPPPRPSPKSSKLELYAGRKGTENNQFRKHSLFLRFYRVLLNSNAHRYLKEIMIFFRKKNTDGKIWIFKSKLSLNFINCLSHFFSQFRSNFFFFCSIVYHHTFI